MIDYAQWHSRIETTVQWRDNYWNGNKAWKRYMALYRGDHWRSYLKTFDDMPDSDTPRDRITVNVTGATILLAKSFLIKQNPKFVGKARKPESTVATYLNQEILNYEYTERKMHKQIKNSILDLIVLGHGVVRTGFTNDVPIAKNPRKQGSIEYREFIKEQAPFIYRVDPFKFVFDIETMDADLNNVSWCGEIFFRSKEDVCSDSSYDKSVVKSIEDGYEEPEYTSLKMLGAGRETIDKEENRRCVLYEIWDKKYFKYYVFCKGVEKPLIEQEWPYDYLEGFPYEKVDFIPLINEPYGLGIPAFIEDQQLELNRIRTQQFDHRRRFNRKYQIINNEVEPGEEEKLISGETGTIVHVASANSILPIPESTIPSDAFNIEGVIKRDIQELTGVDELVRGGNLPSRTSAAEINARVQFSNLKLDDRVQDIDGFILEIGRKVLQHIQANYDKERIIRVIGPAGYYWITYTNEDIQGEFDLEMDTVSAPKVDPVADRQQAIQILTLVLQNLPMLQQSGVQVNVGELFKWYFNKLDEKDVARFFPLSNVIGKPLQTVTEEQMQQNPNTAQQLPQLNMPQNPQAINAGDLRNQLNGNQSGGGPNNFIPGIQ